MFRLLFLFAFLLAFPTLSSTDHGARDPLDRPHDAARADAERIGPLVQKRFALYAAMQRCGQSDNQYVFNFTKERFEPSERFVLEKAAYAGWQEGRRARRDRDRPLRRRHRPAARRRRRAAGAGRAAARPVRLSPPPP